MPHVEDGDLVARLRQGDRHAFDEVYERYRRRLYGFLVRLTGQQSLAEDLLQETWIRLAQHAPRLAAQTRLAPWLFTVARNLFISHRRWALLDLERLSELRLWRQLQPEPASPFAMVAGNETQRRLEQGIASLPLRYREVVLLVAVERMEPSQAAAVLGLQPATVRQRLSRARAMLFVVLEAGRNHNDAEGESS